MSTQKYQPPKAAIENAKKSLEYRDKYGSDAGTKVGWIRANQLARGDELSLDIVKRMAQFNRHRKNSKVAPEYKNEPWKDKGYISWLNWGGDEGVDWAIKIVDSLEEDCWDGYTQKGYKKKGNRTVPNCVKEDSIPREAMPQVKKEDYPQMIRFFVENGFRVRFEKISPYLATPSQAINTDKVDDLIKSKSIKKSIILDKNFQIVDGHHRWAACEKLGVECNAIVIEADFDQIFTTLKNFPKTFYAQG